MSQKFAAKVLAFYEMRNIRVTEYLHLSYLNSMSLLILRLVAIKEHFRYLTCHGLNQSC